MKLNRFYFYFKAVKLIKKQSGRLEKDGWVIKGDLDLYWLGLCFLPPIKKVGGNFHCGNNKLTTLQGAPQEVGGYFSCSHNQLTTLQGAPQKVGSSFYCYNNELTTLQGAPQEVGGNFYCGGNQIKDYSELSKIIVKGIIR